MQEACLFDIKFSLKLSLKKTTSLTQTHRNTKKTLKSKLDLTSKNTETPTICMLGSLRQLYLKIFLTNYAQFL